MKLTNEDGKTLIKLARDSISACFKNRELDADKAVRERFSGKMGVFVTLTVKGDLRGCIGFTDAIYPLWEAVAKAAKAAAFEDPRFPPLTEEEFREAKIEVSVLTKPELVEGKPDDYPGKIMIGRHGIIVDKGLNKGLLLPQVFTEYGADAKQALDMTCQKAGLAPEAWKDAGCRVYLFSAKIFKEE